MCSVHSITYNVEKSKLYVVIALKECLVSEAINPLYMYLYKALK